MSANIFIDAENVKPEIGLKAVKKFSTEYEVDKVYIIGKEDTLSAKYKAAGYHVQNCYYGKNSADTWLCTEIAKTIFVTPAIDTIIIISSDRDFLAAIKLATDQNRKVIVVSDGNGHKNLKAMLYDLRINPDLIELIDFRSDYFNEPVNQPIAKKGTNKPMKNAPPISNSKKLSKICAKLPPNMQSFFLKRESQVKFIFVKHHDKFSEIPFIDGINLATFANTLRDFKIIGRNEMPDEVIAASFLKVIDEQVFLRDEDEIANADTENAFEDVIDYFVDNADNTKTIFVKNGEDLVEVPFVNGEPFKVFSQLLIGYGVSDGNVKSRQILIGSLLDFRNDKVYFRSDEILDDNAPDDLTTNTKTLREFIKANEDKIYYVTIAHNGAVHKAPFFEGIHMSVFVHMLREMKILGKNTDSKKVLSNNGFTVVNDVVYKDK